MADLFDPADLEIGPELMVPNVTSESAYVPDTNGDPEGSEERARIVAIQLPDFFYRRYRLTDDGSPTFNQSTVDGIMDVFDVKVGTEQSFGDDDDDTKAGYFDSQIEKVRDGVSQLLEIDPQTTGINFLQLTTRTWAEFVSVAYEYQDSYSTINKDDGLPTWLVEREDKMLQLGRKARMLSAVCEQMDDKFGLKSTELERFRVLNEVERRLQRLAEWNFKQHADQSGKIANDMNTASVEHCSSIFDNA